MIRKITLILVCVFTYINLYGYDIYAPFSNELPSHVNSPYRHTNNRRTPYYNSNNHLNKSVSRDNGIDPTNGKGGYKEKTTSDGYTIYYQKGNGKNPTEIWIVDSNGNVINIDGEDMTAFFEDSGYRESLVNGSESTYLDYINFTPLSNDLSILLICCLLYSAVGFIKINIQRN